MPSEELKFIMTLQDQISSELKKVGAGFEEAGHKAGAAHSQIKEGFGEIKEASKLAQEAIEAFLGVYASTEIVNHALEANSKLEQGLFDISRITGKTGHDLEEFAEHFEHVTQGSSQLTTELLKVDAILLKAGLSEEQAAEATKHLADVSSVTRIGTAELTAQLVQMLTAMGVAPEKIGAAADTFVNLSAKVKGGGEEMLRIETILSRQLGGTIKLTIEQLQALSATAADIGGGRQGLLAANLLSREMLLMSEAAAEGGTRLKVIAGLLNTTTEEAKKFITADPAAAVLKLNAAFRAGNAPADVLNRTAQQLGLTLNELQRAGLVSAVWDNYTDKLKGAADAARNFNVTTTLTAQYNKLYKDSVDSLVKAFDTANEALGKVLAPGFAKFNKTLTDGIRDTTEWFKHLDSDTKLIIADFIAYTPAILGLAAGFGLLSKAAGLLLLNPVALWVAGISIAVLATYEAWKNWDTIILSVKKDLQDVIDLKERENFKSVGGLFGGLISILPGGGVIQLIGATSDAVDKLGQSVEKVTERVATFSERFAAALEKPLKGHFSLAGFETGLEGFIPGESARYEQFAKQESAIRAQTEATRQLIASQRNLTGEDKAVEDALAKLNEKYHDQQELLKALTPATIEQAKAAYQLSQTTQTAAAGLKDFFEKFSKDALDQGKIVKGIMQTTMTTIEDTIIKSLDRTKVNWREFTQSILTEILRLAAIRPLLATVFGSGQNGIGGLLGNIAGGNAGRGLIPAGALSGGLTGSGGPIAEQTVASQTVATMTVANVVGLGEALGGITRGIGGGSGLPGIPLIPGVTPGIGEATISTQAGIAAAERGNLTGATSTAGIGFGALLGKYFGGLPRGLGTSLGTGPEPPITEPGSFGDRVEPASEIGSSIPWWLKLFGTPNAGGMAQGGLITQPTLFAFAKGGSMGVAGEAGPEAIMPLSRDASGRLGVSGGGSSVHYNPEMHFYIGGKGEGSSKPNLSSNDMDKFGRHIDDRVRSTVLDAIHQQMRPGGLLQGTGNM